MDTSVTQTPTRLTYGATIQYSLLYMNSYVHEVPEFFRQLVPDIRMRFLDPGFEHRPLGPRIDPRNA